MKATLTRWAGWFNDARRQAVQALVASAVSLLVILGAVSDAQQAALLDLSASALLALQGALGLVLLRAGDRYTWLNTTGRGVIYALGGAIGAAGFAFSLFSSETAGLIVQVATVLASILVGAMQIVNAGTLTAPADPVDDDRLATVAESRAAEQADAGRSFEASPATYAQERRPDLRVGILSGRRQTNAERHQMLEAAARQVGARSLDDGDVFPYVAAMRGVSLDVVLVPYSFPRELAKALAPNLATSTYTGERVQFLA